MVIVPAPDVSAALIPAGSAPLDREQVIGLGIGERDDRGLDVGVVDVGNGRVDIRDRDGGAAHRVAHRRSR